MKWPEKKRRLMRDLHTMADVWGKTVLEAHGFLFEAGGELYFHACQKSLDELPVSREAGRMLCFALLHYGEACPACRTAVLKETFPDGSFVLKAVEAPGEDDDPEAPTMPWSVG